MNESKLNHASHRVACTRGGLANESADQNAHVTSSWAYSRGTLANERKHASHLMGIYLRRFVACTIGGLANESADENAHVTLSCAYSRGTLANGRS